MSEYKKIENCKAEVTVEVESAKWSDAQKSAFNKLAKKVEIKGFRKGQAPANLLKKAINEGSVLLEAVDLVAQDALNAVVEEHKIELINRPELKVDALTAEKCVLTFVCPVEPDVTLGDYNNLGYSVEEVTVTDEEVDEQINRLRERKADLELKEGGEVENGDIAIIDYCGYKDGETFDGGAAENYSLTIGSNTFIPGFEEQLIGMKEEEERDINVTFPEDYPAETLRAQPVVFKVTCHEIKKKVLPELNDEFVESLKNDNYKTVEDLKKFYKEEMEARKKGNAERTAVDNLITKLAESTEVEVPQIMIDRELDQMIQEYRQMVEQQGMSFQQYLYMSNSTEESLKESLKGNALTRIKSDLALKAISVKENISASEEDVEAQIKDMAERYSMSVEEVKEAIDVKALAKEMSLQKVIEFLKK